MREVYGSVLCGVDEAGRGPLAGPVVVAAVILPDGFIIDNLNDSKKMTEHSRELAFESIIENALDYSIVFVDNNTIDEVNILNATLLGMRNAIGNLKIKLDVVLIDGNSAPDDIDNLKMIVKGDALSASIAAASVLAKVSRDRYMIDISTVYPDYGFEKHKGYATKAHYEAINKYGLIGIHRRSFFVKDNRYFNRNSLK